MLTMGLLSIDVVRRRSYELFLLGHSLWPWVLLFGYLHTSHSQTPAIYPFAPVSAIDAHDSVAMMMYIYPSLQRLDFHRNPIYFY